MSGAAADRLSESDAKGIDVLLADVQGCVVDAVVSVRCALIRLRAAAAAAASSRCAPTLP